jgi:hypothetical protein
MAAILKRNLGDGGKHLDREGKDGEQLYDVLKEIITTLGAIKTAYDGHTHDGTADPLPEGEKFSISVTIE